MLTVLPLARHTHGIKGDDLQLSAKALKMPPFQPHLWDAHFLLTPTSTTCHRSRGLGTDVAAR